MTEQISEADRALIRMLADPLFQRLQRCLGEARLAKVLIRLAAPSDTASKLLKELGVDGSDPVFAKVRKVTAILVRAEKVGKHLEIAAELFGLRDGPAVCAALLS